MNGVIAPKPKYCPNLVLWWPRPWICETQNVISSLSYHSTYFHQIQRNSIHAFWSVAWTRLWTDERKDRWTDGQNDRWTEEWMDGQPENIMPPAPPKWVEAYKYLVVIWSKSDHLWEVVMMRKFQMNVSKLLFVVCCNCMICSPYFAGGHKFFDFLFSWMSLIIFSPRGTQ